MTNTMTYEKLYNNMVKKFTVESDKKDYTLGDYMLMKAQNKKNALTTVANESNLPVACDGKDNAIAAIFTYVNDKLTVKKAPVRDKTMRSFPLRTAFSSLCSALVVCALVVSCAFFGISSLSSMNNIASTEEEIEENLHEEVITLSAYTDADII